MCYLCRRTRRDSLTFPPHHRHLLGPKQETKRLLAVSPLPLHGPQHEIKIISTLFRTAVPCWRQTTWNLSGLSPQWDCSSKRLTIPVSPRQSDTPYQSRFVFPRTSRAVIKRFRSAPPFSCEARNTYLSIIPNDLSPPRECRPEERGCEPFRTAVPFRVQTVHSSSSLSPKRDCASKGVEWCLLRLSCTRFVFLSASDGGWVWGVVVGRSRRYNVAPRLDAPQLAGQHEGWTSDGLRHQLPAGRYTPPLRFYRVRMYVLRISYCCWVIVAVDLLNRLGSSSSALGCGGTCSAAVFWSRALWMAGAHP